MSNDTSRLDAFVETLFTNLSKSSGRSISAELLAIPPATAFPNGLPPAADQADLLAAADHIGAFVSIGSGEISKLEFHLTVKAFGEVNGTSYCPGLADATA